MTNLPKPKEEGDKMNCPNCNSPIIARLKTYKNNQYPSYIQWQNIEETKAHLDKEGNCSTSTQTESSTVPTTTGTATTTVEPTPSKEKLPEISPELKSLIECDTLLQYQVHLTTKNFIEKFEDNPNGGMIGAFANRNYEKHCKADFKKASEL